MHPKPSGGRWQPLPRLARPLHQDRVTFGREPLPVKVRGFVRRTQAVAIEVKDRTAAPLIAVHQGVGGTGGRREDAESARDSLNEGRLPRSELALEGEQRARRERAAQRDPLRLELLLRQLADHACRRSRGTPPRRTSGAPSALSSFTWSRSRAASSNSRLAAAWRIWRSRAWITAARLAGSCRSTRSCSAGLGSGRSVRASATWVESRTSSIDLIMERGVMPCSSL